jgi:sugar/nucleoside kinase (ribokinase family)
MTRVWAEQSQPEKTEHLLLVGEPLREFIADQEKDPPIGDNGFAGDVWPNTAFYTKNGLAALKDSKTQISVFGAVGTDEASEKLLKMVQDKGINTDLVIKNPDKTLGSVTNDKYLQRMGQEAASRKLDRANSASRDMFDKMDKKGMETLLEGKSSLYISGVILGAVKQRGKVIELMKLAKEKGIKVIFSTNLRPQVWAFEGQDELFELKPGVLRPMFDELTTGKIMEMISEKRFEGVVKGLGKEAEARVNAFKTQFAENPDAKLPSEDASKLATSLKKLSDAYQKSAYYMDEALKYADVVFASQDDERNMHPECGSPAKSAERIHKLSPAKEIIVTDGGKPARIQCYNAQGHQASAENIPVPSNIKVEDITGAGDSFAGTYMALRFMGKLPFMAASKAAQVGSHVVQFEGALPSSEGQVPYATIFANIQGQGSGRPGAKM